ncbi:MAG TPA: hypothetical protein VIL85_27425 [Thermomicrobiales bacterium]
MTTDHTGNNNGSGQTPAITYLQPEQPEDGQAAVAAIVNVAGQEFPLTIQHAKPSEDGGWSLTFGDLADEGRFRTFAEALRVAHERIGRDAAELARALQDVGY